MECLSTKASLACPPKNFHLSLQICPPVCDWGEANTKVTPCVTMGGGLFKKMHCILMPFTYWHSKGKHQHPTPSDRGGWSAKKVKSLLSLQQPMYKWQHINFCMAFGPPPPCQGGGKCKKGQIPKLHQINSEPSFLAHLAGLQVQNMVLHKIYLGCYAKNPLLGKHSFVYHFTPNQLWCLKLGSFGWVSGAECGFTQKFNLVTMQRIHCLRNISIFCHFIWNQTWRLKIMIVFMVSEKCFQLHVDCVEKHC